MTKEELVSELAGRANLTRRAAAAAIDNLLDNPGDYWAQRMAGYLASAQQVAA